MKLLDGRTLAAAIRSRLKKEIADKGLKPGLAVILVGDDPASHLYVSLKEKACREVGINFWRYEFPATATADEILEKLEDLNTDSKVTGILVQLPLPAHLNEKEIIGAMNPAKDADGFHPETLKRFLEGDPAATPGLVAAILTLINSSGQSLQGKQALVLGNSFVFAQPLLAALKQRGAEANYLAPADQWHTAAKNADVVIVAVGRAGFIRGNMLKPGTVIIDVGTNRVNDKIVGDVDAATVAHIDGWLSPVPGGVGPMTVACLLERVVQLAGK